MKKGIHAFSWSTATVLQQFSKKFSLFKQHCTNHIIIVNSIFSFEEPIEHITPNPCYLFFQKGVTKKNLWPLFAILLCLYWLCILKKRPKSTFCRHHPICTHSHIPAERVPWFYGLDLSQFSTLTATSIPYLWMEPEYQFKIRSWYHLP